jgi:hypothetical protein
MVAVGLDPELILGLPSCVRIVMILAMGWMVHGVVLATGWVMVCCWWWMRVAWWMCCLHRVVCSFSAADTHLPLCTTLPGGVVYDLEYVVPIMRVMNVNDGFRASERYLLRCGHMWLPPHRFALGVSSMAAPRGDCGSHSWGSRWSTNDMIMTCDGCISIDMSTCIVW